MSPAKRVIAGQNRAKAKGVKMGRPSKMNDGLRSAIQLLRSNGMGIKQIAREVGVGIGTIYGSVAIRISSFSGTLQVVFGIGQIRYW
ncbi:MAG: hypothetical protein EXR37_00385 [Limnohabitans sp.]|nr:hypothetical protein [Limnohabitans sp.]